ncbi:PREDICTED: uncharacterized protein LOC108372165 [Rhagoletis zephyria]|uniref:uncharacterized protein LOC108372165 n=1 Tax=Rhagoletis zephyria TaxID=28612 RepID=UPI0008113D5B|nr:PREDICTED: uncharacterized protein LOC108372165 [Rhagoletis zephyria]
MVHIEIHDIDEVTTSEEVCLALNGQGGSTKGQVSDIRSMRKAYGGTQTATLLLSESAANKLVAQGKIRIGWVICRIRHKIQPKLCYKCFEFGHISKGCRISDDFGKSCFKCDQSGHTAKLCTNAPRCLLCVKRGSISTSHQAGGNKCPVYQQALSKIKRPLVSTMDGDPLSAVGPVTEEETTLATAKVELNKAPGPDGVPNINEWNFSSNLEEAKACFNTYAG